MSSALSPSDATLPTEGPGLDGLEDLQRGILWLTPRVKFSRFGAGRLVLGRGDDSSPPLPGAEISRHHAELVPQGAVVLLRDLDSTNGTFHNGLKIQEAVLARQDIVRLGEWVGVVSAVPSNVEPSVQRIDGFWAGPSLQAVVANATKIASSDLPILLYGETGTGKEILSRFIHKKSRRSGEFVAVNCAALPESLAEAELFGYRKGAFTGAERASRGHLRSAHGGSLLLDEISDLPFGMQAKFLRALEESSVTPLGESKPVSFDVRVIAAGQTALADAVAAARFRGDLYARLNGIELTLPPLRERREEVPFIFRSVASLAGQNFRLHPLVVERLCIYDWPFNVRELVLLAKRIATLHGGSETIRLEHVPAEILGSGTNPKLRAAPVNLDDDVTEESSVATPRVRTYAPDPGPTQSRRDQARRHKAQLMAELLEKMRGNGGNITDAAKSLGISRQKAYRLLEGQREFQLDESLE